MAMKTAGSRAEGTQPVKAIQVRITFDIVENETPRYEIRELLERLLLEHFVHVQDWSVRWVTDEDDAKRLLGSTPGDGNGGT